MRNRKTKIAKTERGGESERQKRREGERENDVEGGRVRKRERERNTHFEIHLCRWWMNLELVFQEFSQRYDSGMQAVSERAVSELHQLVSLYLFTTLW